MFWACRVPCLGAEWRMLVTVTPLRPHIPGAPLGVGVGPEQRADVSTQQLPREAG